MSARGSPAAAVFDETRAHYDRAMELLGAFLLMAVAATLVGWLLSSVKSARERRMGTGSWTRHGPSPTPERIANVRTAERCWREGLSAIADRSSVYILQPFILDPKRATIEERWKQAAEMGDERAAVGLGILAYLERDAERADEYWRGARELALPKSDAAIVMQKLVAADTSESQATSSAEAFLKAEGAASGREQIRAIKEVRKVAVDHARTDFAESYTEALDRLIRSTYS